MESHDLLFNNLCGVSTTLNVLGRCVHILKCDSCPGGIQLQHEFLIYGFLMASPPFSFVCCMILDRLINLSGSVSSFVKSDSGIYLLCVSYELNEMIALKAQFLTHNKPSINVICKWV